MKVKENITGGKMIVRLDIAFKLTLVVVAMHFAGIIFQII